MPLDPEARPEPPARPRGRRGGHAGARALSCSFCGESEEHVSQLIAGPGHYICNRCVDRAQTALTGPGAAVAPAGAIWRVSDAAQDVSCSFCGKGGYRVGAMAVAEGGGICDECLDLCREVIADSQA